MALRDEAAVEQQRLRERRLQARESPRARDRPPSGSTSCAPATAAPGSPRSASSSSATAPSRSSESSFRRRQKSPRASLMISELLVGEPGPAVSPDQREPPETSASTASAEPSSEALSSTRISCSMPSGWVSPNRPQTLEQEIPPVGVHHAVREFHRQNPGECASRSSIRPPTRRRTTGRCALPWHAPGRRWSWSRAASSTAPCRAPMGYEVRELFYRQSDRARGRQRRAPRPEAGRARQGHGASPVRLEAPPTSAITSGSRCRRSTATSSHPPARGS